MIPPTSRALESLPGYPLAGFKERRMELEAKGVDVIDLGAGDADLPPPPAVVEALGRAARDPAMSRYPFQVGLPAFRSQVSRWMEKRFGVTLDANREILPLIGCVLIMSVDPGFAGQSFIAGTFRKIEQLVEFREDNNLVFSIQVDGGVNKNNYQELAKSGVDIVVAGKAFFTAEDKAAFCRMIQGV